MSGRISLDRVSQALNRHSHGREGAPACSFTRAVRRAIRRLGSRRREISGGVAEGGRNRGRELALIRQSPDCPWGRSFKAGATDGPRSAPEARYRTRVLPSTLHGPLVEFTQPVTDEPSCPVEGWTSALAAHLLQPSRHQPQILRRFLRGEPLVGEDGVLPPLAHNLASNRAGELLNPARFAGPGTNLVSLRREDASIWRTRSGFRRCRIRPAAILERVL